MTNQASPSATIFSGHDGNFEPIIGSFPAEIKAKICP